MYSYLSVNPFLLKKNRPINADSSTPSFKCPFIWFPPSFASNKLIIVKWGLLRKFWGIRPFSWKVCFQLFLFMQSVFLHNILRFNLTPISKRSVLMCRWSLDFLNSDMIYFTPLSFTLMKCYHNEKKDCIAYIYIVRWRLNLANIWW